MKDKANNSSKVENMPLNIMVKTKNGSLPQRDMITHEEMQAILDHEGIQCPIQPTKTITLEDALESVERIKSILPNQQEKDYFQNKMNPRIRN